jgi:dienelactone hydrolase
VAHVRFEGPHDFTRPMREAVYAWFNRWLLGIEDPAAAREPELALEEPAVLRALDGPPAGMRGPEGAAAYYAEHAAFKPARIEGRDARRTWQEKLRAQITDLLGEPLALPVAIEPMRQGAGGRGQGSGGTGVPGAEPPVYTGQTPLKRAERTRGELLSVSRFEAVTLRSEPEIRLPALILSPPGEPEPPERPNARTPERPNALPAVIFLHPEGKAGWLEGGEPQGLARRALAAGARVLLPDVRLRGELAADWLCNTILWGRPEAGMAAHDVSACVDYLWARGDVDRRRVIVVGVGDQGIVALLAAGLDERITAVAADCGDTTYRDGGEGLPVIPNLLRVADTPQLAALAAPRATLLFRVPPDRAGFASLRYFDGARRAFQALGAEPALTIRTTTETPLPAVEAWLEAQLAGTTSGRKPTKDQRQKEARKRERRSREGAAPGD